MTTVPEQFRYEVSEALVMRPYKTSYGKVVETMVPITMGYPGDFHNVPPAWVYQHDASGLEMVFQFHRNFTDHDLICKVVHPGQYPASGEGASIQFNSDYCIRSVPPYCELVHHGRITVKRAIPRVRLINLMSRACPDAMLKVGISANFNNAWPISIGVTGDISSLLDRLFLYAYCVEQAKRTIRQETPLPLIT
ncbi:MAG: hypothetical protein MN733_33655 [Nitrososphaera sp.]|nr:hypothetical protein [Nitrososphaera sp.]